MASSPDSNLVTIQSNIDLIAEVLRNCTPFDAPYYQGILDDLYLQLHQVQQAQNPTPGPSGTNGPSSPLGTSSATAVPLTNYRKRSRDHLAADFPQAKRISAQPSPDTPSTPLTIRDSPEASGSQPFVLPTRPFSSATVVDLTNSGPPSPAEDPERFPDPFPELEHAYRDNNPHTPRKEPERLDPADAFNQDIMQQNDLTEYMLTPTQAGKGYAFHNHKASDIRGFFNREIPHLPGSEVPQWMNGDIDSDDYGEFPVNAVEADAIEKLLENIKEHGETPEDREQTPAKMRSQLKEFQKIGLTWLLKMEGGISKGGILADEMGLGKTVCECSVQMSWNYMLDSIY